MKKNYFILIYMAMVFVSCAAYKSVNLSRIFPGMTKAQVIGALKKKPDNLIGAKQYPTGRLEVLQYSRYEPWAGSLAEQYWLYFFNDTLIQWGRPGDWQREADHIVEIRSK